MKQKILSLPVSYRERLLKEIDHRHRAGDLTLYSSLCNELDKKLGQWPHFSHNKYVCFGTDEGARCYKCKSGKRSFTDYASTWINRFQRRDKVGAYLDQMMQKKSQGKISGALGFNKIAFDWRQRSFPYKKHVNSAHNKIKKWIDNTF